MRGGRRLQLIKDPRSLPLLPDGSSGVTLAKEALVMAMQSLGTDARAQFGCRIGLSPSSAAITVRTAPRLASESTDARPSRTVDDPEGDNRISTRDPWW
jgi:hypothetical protein